MGNQESFSPKIQNRQDRALTEPNPKMDKIKPNLNDNKMNSTKILNELLSYKNRLKIF